MDDSGSFLGRGKGCLIVSDKKRKVEKYPLFENEVGEVQIKIGNLVSSGALATCAFWNIDLVILTQRGNPVAVLKSLDDDSHVKTRIGQYEAINHRVGRLHKHYLTAHNHLRLFHTPTMTNRYSIAL